MADDPFGDAFPTLAPKDDAKDQPEAAPAEQPEQQPPPGLVEQPQPVPADAVPEQPVPEQPAEPVPVNEVPPADPAAPAVLSNVPLDDGSQAGHEDPQADQPAEAPAVVEEEKKAVEPEADKPAHAPLQISVTEPEKKGEGMHQFISYKVNTLKETAPGSGKFAQVQVVRRFSDFSWLHDQLLVKYKGYLIPPIPDKAIMGRFSGEFINERKRGLELFLTRTAAHPELHTSKDFEVFLFADDEGLAKTKEKPAEGRGGFMSFLKDSYHSVATTVGVEKPRDKTPEDVAADKINSYAVSLEQAFGNVGTNMEKLCEKSRAMATAWFEFGLACTLIGQLESGHSEQHLSTVFSKIGTCADRLCPLMNKKRENEEVQFWEVFKDYLRVSKSMQAMIKERNAVLQSYNQAMAKLESRQADLAAVQGKPGKEPKALAMDKLVVEQQAVVNKLQQDLVTMNDRVQRETAQFNKEKYKAFKHAGEQFVLLQIAHAKKVQETFESILPDLANLP